MKKRFTLLFAALLAFVGVAKADFTQTWTSSTNWGADLTDMPKDVETLKGANKAKALLSGVTVTEGATVTVGFTYTGGDCALNIIGVDLMTIEGEVVASHYESMKAGGNKVEQLYTLSNVPAGNYFLRYFVWYGSNDRLDATNGNIKVTGAEVYEFSTVTFTYNYIFDGKSKIKEEHTAYVGMSYPAPSALPYGVEAEAPYGEVKEGDDGKTKNIWCDVAENFPFEFAEEYSAITKWCYLKLKGSYLFHEKNAEYLAIGKTAVEAGKETAYAWAFVGNPFDGFMLVNNAAGEGWILSSSTTMSGSNGGGTYPIMTELAKLPEGNNTYWVVTPSTHAEGGFYLEQKGHSSNKMNNRDGKLAYWSTGADAGSTFVVETPELSLSLLGASVGDVAIVEGAATVESISTIDITFDRPVALAEGAWATILDPWGGANLQAEVLADNNCVVRFTVDEYFDPFEYVLNIPAGLIVDAATGLYANAAIEAVITIEGGSDTPSASLNVVNVTVGEDVMEGFIAVAAPGAAIKVNFDGMFYLQSDPTIVDAKGENALGSFDYMSGIDYDGSYSYVFFGKNVGTYTITLAKAAFMEYLPMYKAPAEDIVLTVQIADGSEGEEGGEDPTEPTPGEGETGVENSQLTTNNSQLIYDLSGRRVEKMTKGLYIVNGKKVLVK